MLAGLIGPLWIFCLLLLLIHFLCMREFFKLFDRMSRRPSTTTTQYLAQAFGLLFLGALMYSLLPKMTEWITPYEGGGHGLPHLFSPYLVMGLILYPAVLLVQTAISAVNSPLGAATAFTGHLYITLPITLLLFLRLSEGVFPLMLIACIWMNDTFAYLCGSLIGRTPLTPISPKKTWEGTGGGALLTVGAAFAVSYYLPDYPYELTVGMALCAAVAGTLGDLLESRMKRLADLKDSGNMMPGHGGALDRFDSLLVATPFAFGYLWVMGLL